jgi:hypothetical protein
MKGPLIYRRSFYYPLLLLVTYSLHLGVFNAMMDASFQIKDNLVHFCFDRNSQTNNAHPCMAADYQRLLKHEDSKKHNFVYQSSSVLFLLALLSVPFTISSNQANTYRLHRFFNLADDAFKRYSLLNVFLI